MPTYTIYAPRGQLSSEQKKTIAGAITRTHETVTGARSFFAQVLFIEIPHENWFMGGGALQTEQLYVCGHIRGGRSPELKRDLILGLRDALAIGASVSRSKVWAYLVEVPPSLMVEYGHVLPVPGQEEIWLAELPPEDRALLEAMGRRA
ncbi:MAG: tautomerase family protein [Burkholderiaceae bacterium]|jgi:phenylpyruvate tautomerase PptA (4-oxalocrotonate tautomerase family)